ncbi:TetR/AcrR family transcriptional regulator [Rhodococcus wratislaviensis]|uniref:Putative TetR family transcriptional regulator n=1 Tax=Rhodococcus wratislaviensis NBRC 100605 TaxID=1219028 RepID=X0PW18_RHOWR|nr:putative TetR family transcriptional regulator [Rhodococcus wratislaviensis NBRC 100605]
MVVTPELRADAARNRSLVLAAGRRRLVEQGLPLPMNTIARAAGVGVGTAYRHFPTQADLLQAIAEPAFADLVGQARAAVAAPDPAGGSGSCWMRRFANWLIRRSPWCWLLSRFPTTRRSPDPRGNWRS